jgi:predicted dehydrogenase
MPRSGKKLRAGVIGTGMGRYHMEGFATHPRSELLAVCDLNVPEARAFAEKYGAKHVFRDYRDMIAMEELDVVAVAAPTHLHARMTIDALKAGKDVLCEKPMATKLADAEAMVREAKRRRKRLLIHMIMRFSPLHWEMHGRVARGDLGDVYYARSHWIRRKGIPRADFAADGDMGRGEWFVKKRQAGGGASFDIGVHIFDLAWWLIGAPKPKSVLAATYSELLPPRLAKVGVKGDVDDLAAVLVRFDTGQTVFAEVTWDAHQKPFLGYELFGTERGASWSEWADFATIYQDDRRGRPGERTVRARRKAPSAYWHFVDACLDRRTKMVASGEECLTVARVLDAIQTSQKTGKAVSL